MTGYTFRLATNHDKKAIFDFMDENWGEKHPLLHVEDFFDYYYQTSTGINFAIAQTHDTAEIKSVCGYILCNEHGSDIWASIWCAKKEKGSTGIGLELMSRMQKLTGAENISCNNIRPETMVFYHLLGYVAEVLPHYYMLNPSVASYKVAKIISPSKATSCKKTDISLQKADTIGDLQNFCMPSDLRPKKDLWHIQRRYFDYPKQSYDVYSCLDQNKNILGVLVIQKIIVCESIVLRIVDFVGKQIVFASLGYAIRKLVLEENAEYIDCYCYGVPQTIFERLGFVLRIENDANIIPNYLNPIKYENTDYYFFASNTEKFTMWKADGDQNRPFI